MVPLHQVYWLEIDEAVDLSSPQITHLEIHLAEWKSNLEKNFTSNKQNP